jgi:hypothetical protein
VVKGVGLSPLAFWDCGFESRRRYAHLSTENVGCCHVEFLRRADPSSRGVLPSVFVCVCVYVSQTVIRCNDKLLHLQLAGI